MGNILDVLAAYAQNDTIQVKPRQGTCLAKIGRTIGSFFNASLATAAEKCSLRVIATDLTKVLGSFKDNPINQGNHAVFCSAAVGLSSLITRWSQKKRGVFGRIAFAVHNFFFGTQKKLEACRDRMVKWESAYDINSRTASGNQLFTNGTWSGPSLELGVSGESREGDHVSNVFHSGSK